MDDMFTRMNNWELTLEIEDLIKEQHYLLDLAVVVRAITNIFVSVEALMNIFWKFWGKKGGLEFKVLECTIFTFFFKLFGDLEMAL